MDTHPGENILFEGHPSWRSILGYYMKAMGLAALAGALAAGVSRVAEDEVKTGWVATAVLVVLGVALVVGLLKRISTTYTISDQRLHIKRGIISRRVQETRLERVQNVNTDQSALERLLQVGTVDFDTAGSDDYDFTFAGVANPDEVSHAVDTAIREIGARGDGDAAPQPRAQRPRDV